jgi:hypothetical protein
MISTPIFGCCLSKPGFQRKNKMTGINTAKYRRTGEDKRNTGRIVIAGRGQYSVGTPAENAPTQAGISKLAPKTSAFTREFMTITHPTDG